MIPKLKRDNWYKNEFPIVREANVNMKRALQYASDETKKLNKGITFWERPHLETKVGQRKRHIIVFNADKQPFINLNFEFDDFLKKQFIHKKSEPYASVSGKKLMVTLPSSEGILLSN